MRLLKLLAIETSTEACSAALYLAGELFEEYQLAPRRHGELILKMADTLLAGAGLSPTQLDAVAFGRGPGAFTGVRIGTSVAQGIAFGADLPVVAVSTLAVVAQGAYARLGGARQLAVMDARMGEVYWGAFQAAGEVVEPVRDEQLCAPGAVPVVDGQGWLGCGSGWKVYGDSLRSVYGDRLGEIDPEALPRAGDLARLAADRFSREGGVAPEQVLPVYLRDSVAKKAGAE